MQLVAKLKEIKRKGWNWSTIKKIKDPRTKLKKNKEIKGHVFKHKNSI
jgi:hypothetical protein